MAIAFIQSAKNAAGSSFSLVKAFTSNNTAGNCLILVVGVWKSGGGFSSPTVSDSAGNSWVKVCSSPKSASQCFIYVAYNCFGGANTVTVAVAAGGDLDMAIHEYSGIVASGLDQNAALARGSAGDLTFTLNTQKANELLFCVGYDQSKASTVFTPSAGWTGREQTANSGGETLKSFDRIVSATGTYTNTVTCSASSNGYHLLAASFADTPRSTYLVQSESEGGGGTTFSRSFRANNTAGNVLVVAVAVWISGVLPTVTVTDSRGNTWILASGTSTATFSGQSKLFVYYVASCLAGANTVTLTLGASAWGLMAIHEYATTISNPVALNAMVQSGATAIATGLVASGGPLFGVAYDQSTAAQGLVAAFTGEGWLTREGTGPGSGSGSSSLVSFDQIAVGSIGLSITAWTNSTALHAIILSFVGSASVVAQPQMKVIT